MSELIEAAKAGDAAVARRIMRDSPAAAAARSESGETPLIAALYRGHQDLASEIGDVIEASGARLDVFAAAALGRLDALATALRESGAVSSFAYDGWTPLHLAAFFGQLTAAQHLIDAGAPVSARSANSMGNTPLHAAVAGGRTDVALLLIERGADVNVADAAGLTPLHIAAENGNVPVVDALMKRGADPHAVDSEDKTPLSRAAARNHTAVVDAINTGT